MHGLRHISLIHRRMASLSSGPVPSLPGWAIWYSLDSEALPQEARGGDEGHCPGIARCDARVRLAAYLISEKSASRWMPGNWASTVFAGGCSSIRLTAMRRATPGAGST